MPDLRRAFRLALLAVALGAAIGPLAGRSPSAELPRAQAAETGRVIVRFRDPAAGGAGARGAQALSGEPTGRPGVRLVRVPAGTERESAARLAARPDVLYAEPDAVVRTQAVPNDPLYASNQWNLPLIGAPAAWDVTIGDPGVTVAVIDTGFDIGHPDAPANLAVGCDYVTWGSLGYVGPCPSVVDDQYGHGTHVAGVIAARQNNGLDVTGAAPGVTVLAIRVLDAQGSGYALDVAAAIEAATDAGARVINLSLGGTSSSTRQQEAIDYALAHGVVVVAAAGNDSGQGDVVSYPAGDPGVLAVGAITYDERHAAYSNFGSYVALSAPGGSNSSSGRARDAITSLYPRALGSVKRLVGTSQATPHVAAAAALVLSVRPGLSGADVAGLLRTTAHPLGAGVPNSTFGYGRVDLLAAVQAARALAPAITPTATGRATITPTPAYSPSPTATPDRTPTPPGPETGTPSASPTTTPTPRPTQPPPPTTAPPASMTPATPTPRFTQPPTMIASPGPDEPTLTPASQPGGTTPPVTATPTANPSPMVSPTRTGQTTPASTPTPTPTSSPTPGAASSPAAAVTPTFAPISTNLSPDATAPFVAETGDQLLRVTVPPGVAAGRGELRLELAGASIPSIVAYRGIKAVEVSLYAGLDRIGQLDRSMTVDLGYDPAQLPRPDLGESNLLMYTSSDGVRWTPLPTVVDRINHRVRVSTDHLSVFALVQPLYRQRLELVLRGRMTP